MERTKKMSIYKYRNDQLIALDDVCSIEEPLEIRLTFGPISDRKTESIAITMRTPGHDEELALGFLLNEGIINAETKILSIKKSTVVKSRYNPNIITLALTPDFIPDLDKLNRNFYTTSSCGICGKASVDALIDACPVEIDKDEAVFDITDILNMPAKLRQQQTDFEQTGGIHASGLFDHFGNLLIIREDVGRHNALDKISGWMYNNGVLHNNNPYMVMLSGRISYELVQKSAMSGIKLLAAVGAPSTLAIQAATALNISLIGFLRGENFNIYSHRERIRIQY